MLRMSLFLLGILLYLNVFNLHSAESAVSLKALPTNYLSQLGSQDLFAKQTFFRSQSGFPQWQAGSTQPDIGQWLEQLKPHSKIQFDGDTVWAVHRISNDTQLHEWTTYVFGSAIEYIDYKLYPLGQAEEAEVQSRTTGYFAEHDIPYHYTATFELTPGQDYLLVTRLSSEFFFAPLKLQFKPKEAFVDQFKLENAAILLCFGIGLALALYNLFVFIGSRDKLYLYYALFTFSWIWGWAHSFNLPEEWFGTRTPGFLMTGFVLLPLFNALFFIRFLRVKKTNPVLSKVGLWIGIICLAGVPVAIEAPAYGLILASLGTGGMLIVGFTLGVKKLLRGFKPAKYFLMAYIMLLLPNMVGNLMNIGIIPSMNVNIYLLGLIGSMLDGLLLAFAMADNVRLVNQKNIELNENLEEKINQRTEKLEKTTQELREASLAKSRFLAQMSHEIRTPMNAVIGLSQLALRTPLNFEQKDYVTKIASSADILLGIINDVLDYSKIEAGKLNIEQVNFNLEKCIERAVNLCSLKANTKNIELILDIQPNVPKFIESDPLRLQQVLVNIISNAVKFTDYGHVSVRVSAKQIASGQYNIEFAVVDTGIGMDKPQLDRLFSSFTQADTSITRKYGGTGLGLAISKELVILLGGDIWVNSKPGVGSAFHFNIKAQMTQQTAESTQLSIKGRSLNVLVVDDNEVASDVIVDLFKRHNATIKAVRTGIEAINELQQALLNKYQYDLVVMDWKMPEMDGIQAAKMIKQDLNLSSLPAILMVSAYDKDEAKRLGEQAGIDGFIEKPVNESTLLNALAECLPLDMCESPGGINPVENPGFLDLSNIKLLLVEDNKLNRQVAAGFLRDTGIQIDVAENGKQAIDKVLNQSFDIVLMDIQMPLMDGLTATREIRKQSQFDELPIVAMTAHAMEGDKQRSYEAGMNDHLTKPVDPNELYRCIVKWIKQEKLQPPQGKTAGSAKVSAIDESLANLQTIGLLDVAGALKKMHGKKALYIELLVTFIEENQHLATELRQLKSDNELDALRLKVHSLKSNAAYIGALHLSKDAATVESAIEASQNFDAEFGAMLDKLTSILAELKNISREMIQTEADKQASARQTEPLKPQEIKAAFEQIKQYLSESNAKVEDYIPVLRQLATQVDCVDLIDELISLIDDVEYKQALNFIENNQVQLRLI